MAENPIVISKEKALQEKLEAAVAAISADKPAVASGEITVERIGQHILITRREVKQK